MSRAGSLPSAAERSGDLHVVTLVSVAHFVSHYFILLLPPLFLFIRADYGVSYTEIGLALVAFNVTTLALQTPAGFLVDRYSPSGLLIAGLVVGGVSVAVAALVPSFWIFVAMFAGAGVANAVYHPADYALLSRLVSPEGMGRAFSIHTFSGFLGSAAAPASLLFFETVAGWRGALLAASVLALAVAALLYVQQRRLRLPPHAAAPAPARQQASSGAAAGSGLGLLFSAPILQSLALFVFLAIVNGGFQNFSVVALGVLHGTGLEAANIALSAYLLLTAIGVLCGGPLSSRTSRHEAVAFAGLIATTLLAVIIALYDLGSAGLIGAMALAGLSTGMIMPSRDMLVRALTPEGAFGKVFGFVTTGFNIGGVVAPLLFGYLMDSGRPEWVFLGAALCCGAAMLALVIPMRRS